MTLPLLSGEEEQCPICGCDNVVHEDPGSMRDKGECHGCYRCPKEETL